MPFSSAEGASDEFVGRRRELMQILEIAASARRRDLGDFVLLTGEAGSGKSTLARAVLRRASKEGMAAVQAPVDPIGVGPLLGPWRYAADRLWGPFEPAEPAGRGEIDRWSQFSSLLNRIEANAWQSAVILLDDLHRADDETLAFAPFVAAALHQVPLVVIATWRMEAPHAVNEPPAALGQAATRIHLGPMSPADIEEVVAAHGYAAISDTHLRAVQRVARGNPLLALEAARHPTGALDRRSRGGQLIVERLGRLEKEVRSLVEWAAVFGRAVALDLLAAATNLTASEVRAQVIRAEGVLLESNALVSFEHDVLQEAALEAMGAERLSAAHLAVARVLGERLGHDPVVRAEHLLAAGRYGTGDPGQLLIAARHAAQALWGELAWSRAIPWFEIADSTAQTIDSPSRWLEALAHATASQQCGQLHTARRLFRAILAEVPPAFNAIRADAALGAAGIWVEDQRDPIERRQLLEIFSELLTALPVTERSRRAEVSVRVAAERYYDSGGRGLDELEGAMREARAVDDDGMLARTLSILHHCFLGPDFADRRVEIADELQTTGSASGHEFHAMVGLCWSVVDQYLRGDPAAETSYVRFAKRVDTLGVDSLRYIGQVMGVMRVIRAGRLDEAEEAAGNVFEFGSAVGDPDSLGYYVGQIGCIRWAQGRLEELESAAQDVIASGTLRQHDVVYPALLCLTAALQGRASEASEIAYRVLAQGLVDNRMMSTWTTTMAVIGECSYLISDPVLADQAHQAMRPYAGMPVMPSLAVACFGPVDRVLGVTALALGRVHDACQWLTRAVEVNRRLGNLAIAPRLDWELATALRRQGDPDSVRQADVAATRALESADRLGLSSLVSQWTGGPASTRSSASSRPLDTASNVVRTGRLERHDSFWRLGLDEREVTLPDIKGLRYLAVLLRQPGQEINVEALSQLVDGVAQQSTVRSEDPVLDARGRRKLLDRIEAIDAELDRADRRGDAERSERLSTERDEIEAALRAATGRRGALRAMPNPSEAARSRVGNAVRRTLKRIGELDPVMGEELRRTVLLGYYPVYAPLSGSEVAWTVEP